MLNNHRFTEAFPMESIAELQRRRFDAIEAAREHAASEWRRISNELQWKIDEINREYERAADRRLDYVLAPRKAA